MRNTETSTPRWTSVRATTNPSPPLFPRPHSTATCRSDRSVWIASMAATTCRPAFSIRTSDGMPTSSMVRRSASRICAAFSTRIWSAILAYSTGRHVSNHEDTKDVRAQRQENRGHDVVLCGKWLPRSMSTDACSTRSMRSSRSSITGFFTARACTKRYARSTGSRSCSIATCSASAILPGCSRCRSRCPTPSCSSAAGRRCGRPGWGTGRRRKPTSGCS